MAQFYFLSILLNVLIGLILVFGENFLADRFDGEEESQDAKKTFGDLGLDSSSFRLIVGILSVFVGLMKLLSVFKGDVPLIGDLVPAAAGFAGGAALLLEYYIYNSNSDIAVAENIQRVFIDSRKIIGYFCFAAAVLHFVLPQVLFL